MKKDKGLFCDLCGKMIVKYQLDFNSSGAVMMTDINKYVCNECAKFIAIELIEQ